MKICTECKIEKQLDEFSKRKASADGLNFKCKICRYAYNARTKEQNSIRRKKYYADHREHELAKRKVYQQTFPDKCNAVQAKRRAAKLQATPGWANLKNIENIYTECKNIVLETGTEYHVHHIIPLVNDLVCGLHCEANLTIITSKENVEIGNRYWPDMPN